jgi:hypothetical protein
MSKKSGIKPIEEFNIIQSCKMQLVKRKCKIRLYDENFEEVPIIEWDKEKERRRDAATWQDAFCYEMGSEMFSVEDANGFPHRVDKEDIQFLDTQEFYRDK